MGRPTHHENMPSCQHCRSRHIACPGNGVDPCPSCTAKGIECIYPKKRKAGPRKGWMEERMRQHEEVTMELEAAKKTIRQLRSLLARNGVPIPSTIEAEYRVKVEDEEDEELKPIEPTPKRRKRTRSSRAIEAEATEHALDDDELNNSALVLATRDDDYEPRPRLQRIASGSDVTNHFDGITRDPSLKLMRDISQGSGFFKNLQLSRESSWNKEIDRWAEKMVDEELINAGQGLVDFDFPGPETLLDGSSQGASAAPPTFIGGSRSGGSDAVTIQVQSSSVHDKMSQPLTCAQSVQAVTQQPVMAAASGAA